MTLNPARHLLALLAAVAILLSACGDDDDSSSTTTSTTTETTTSTTEDQSTGNETDLDRGAYVAALAGELEDSQGLDVDDGSSSCIAGALVDAVGMDHIESEGITVEDFAAADSLVELGIEVDEASIDRLGAEIDSCVDLLQLMTNTAPAGYECLVDGIESIVLARAFAEQLSNGAEFDPSVVMFEAASPACAEEVFLATGVARGDITPEQAECVADNLDDEVPLRVLTITAQGGTPSQSDVQAMEAAFGACGAEP